MSNLPEVQTPEYWAATECQNQDHWFDILADGRCEYCGGVPEWANRRPMTEAEVDGIAKAESESVAYRNSH